MGRRASVPRKIPQTGRRLAGTGAPSAPRLQHATGTTLRGEGSTRVAGLLKRVLYRFRDSLDDVLRPHGITASQLHVLAMLDRQPGISGAKLARLCMVTPQSMQALVTMAEASGWIERTRHPENERILLATLTPQGEKILMRSRRAVHAIESRMLNGFLPDEIRTLEALLEACSANLDMDSPSKHPE